MVRRVDTLAGIYDVTDTYDSPQTWAYKGEPGFILVASGESSNGRFTWQRKSAPIFFDSQS